MGLCVFFFPPPFLGVNSAVSLNPVMNRQAETETSFGLFLKGTPPCCHPSFCAFVSPSSTRCEFRESITLGSVIFVSVVFFSIIKNERQENNIFNKNEEKVDVQYFLSLCTSRSPTYNQNN